MAENKTKATRASVQAFIKALPEPRRGDAKALVRIMQSVSHEKPKMRGPSIIGFGSNHYRYDSGREGDMPLTCFSPRRESFEDSSGGRSKIACISNTKKPFVSTRDFNHFQATPLSGFLNDW